MELFTTQKTKNNYRKKIDSMRLGREIERLRQRVHKLSIEKDPPTLRMVMVKDEETQQEQSAWDLRVTVERKK